MADRVEERDGTRPDGAKSDPTASLGAGDLSTVHDVIADGSAGRLYLVVIGSGSVATHPLPDAGDVMIGRSEKCDVRLDDPSISRRHAILRVGPPMTIEDLGSANGTRVRGRRLSVGEAAPIGTDEVVDLGSAMMIVQHRSASARPRRFWTHDYFEGRLEEECARAARSGKSFALVRLHCDPNVPTGLVQRVLADGLGALDVAGIYAPGEYEALLTETAPGDAARTVDRILARFGGPGEHVRVGLACYPRDGRSADELVARACAIARGEPSTPAAPAKGDGAEVDRVGGPMQSLHRLVERIAAGTISVLILGETGVGKEVLAETIHRMSPRASKPCVRLNCAALSETLLESELFGHERGAFTGANQVKPGLLETAEGGTVFLDEAGDLPLPLQAKLLRVIEERQVLRVGGLKPRPIDVRFLAATNRDLELEVLKGTFRQDLFFRLNGVTLTIPPLRERVSEIEPLARAFVAQFCARSGRSPAPAISTEALELLKRYSWPGNIRELRNVIERAVLLCPSGSITLEHLPVEKMRATRLPPPPSDPTPPPRLPPPAPATTASSGEPPPPTWREEDGSMDVRREIAQLERRRILDALDRCAGNQTQAATLLGISRRTLVNRLDAYAIARPRKGRSPLGK